MTFIHYAINLKQHTAIIHAQTEQFIRVVSMVQLGVSLTLHSRAKLSYSNCQPLEVHVSENKKHSFKLGPKHLQILCSNMHFVRNKSDLID